MMLLYLFTEKRKRNLITTIKSRNIVSRSHQDELKYGLLGLIMAAKIKVEKQSEGFPKFPLWFLIEDL